MQGMFSIRDLCDDASIPCKVSGPSANLKNIQLLSGVASNGAVQYLADDGREFFVIDRSHLPRETGVPPSLRVLEVLAYVFDHYGAKECVRGQFG